MGRAGGGEASRRAAFPVAFPGPLTVSDAPTDVSDAPSDEG